MRIAVNAVFFRKDNSENYRDSFFSFFLRLSHSHSEHTFIFIFDAPYPPDLNFPENVIPVVTGPEASNPITWRIWYNIKIPAVLKKYNADIFISEKFCSLRTKVPQLLVYPNLKFIHQPSFINKKHLHFYTKYTPRFLNKVDAIIVNSMFCKNNIITQYQINEHKIKVIYPQVDEDFIPLNFEEREKIKEKYAEGNEYFVYVGVISPQQNLMNLLKAFSAFKKRQKSNMQLIIAGRRGIKYEELMKSLKLYRFHKDVKVLENLSADEVGGITASAYAMIYVPFYETSYRALLEAMKCEVPLIVSSTGALPEACADAALYADPHDFKDIAEKMMLVFKDERMRKDLIQKGIVQLNNITTNRREIVSFHGFDFYWE